MHSPEGSPCFVSPAVTAAIAEAFNKLNRASVHDYMVCLVMVDFQDVGLLDVDLQAANYFGRNSLSVGRHPVKLICNTIHKLLFLF